MKLFLSVLVLVILPFSHCAVTQSWPQYIESGTNIFIYRFHTSNYFARIKCLKRIYFQPDLHKDKHKLSSCPIHNGTHSAVLPRQRRRSLLNLRQSALLKNCHLHDDLPQHKPPLSANSQPSHPLPHSWRLIHLRRRISLQSNLLLDDLQLIKSIFILPHRYQLLNQSGRRLRYSCDQRVRYKRS